MIASLIAVAARQVATRGFVGIPHTQTGLIKTSTGMCSSGGLGETGVYARYAR
jgi:hypothetical protein